MPVRLQLGCNKKELNHLLNRCLKPVGYQCEVQATSYLDVGTWTGEEDLECVLQFVLHSPYPHDGMVVGDKKVTGTTVYASKQWSEMCWLAGERGCRAPRQHEICTENCVPKELHGLEVTATAFVGEVPFPIVGKALRLQNAPPGPKTRKLLLQLFHQDTRLTLLCRHDRHGPALRGGLKVGQER